MQSPSAVPRSSVECLRQRRLFQPLPLAHQDQMRLKRGTSKGRDGGGFPLNPHSVANTTAGMNYKAWRSP